MVSTSDLIVGGALLVGGAYLYNKASKGINALSDGWNNLEFPNLSNFFDDWKMPDLPEIFNVDKIKQSFVDNAEKAKLADVWVENKDVDIVLKEVEFKALVNNDNINPNFISGIKTIASSVDAYAAKIIAEKKANEPKPIETYFKPAPVSQAPVFVYKPVPVAPKPAPVVVRPAPVYFAPKPAPVVVPVIKPQILPAALPQQSVYNPMPLPSWATF